MAFNFLFGIYAIYRFKLRIKPSIFSIWFHTFDIAIFGQYILFQFNKF